MKKRKNILAHINHKSKTDTSLDKYDDVILFPKKYEKGKKILATVKFPSRKKRLGLAS